MRWKMSLLSKNPNCLCNLGCRDKYNLLPRLSARTKYFLSRTKDFCPGQKILFVAKKSVFALVKKDLSEVEMDF